MRGPYPLTLIQIDSLIHPKRMGVFLIYNEKREVVYLGRSDEDLTKELKKHIEMGKFFSYEYVVNSKEGYLLECKYFHKYKDNPNFSREDHPIPPPNMEIKCPVCGL
ncbi:MAG: hypothetical protein ABIK76_06435 [candidate division WOR-3 bacterium]